MYVMYVIILGILKVDMSLYDHWYGSQFLMPLSQGSTLLQQRNSDISSRRAEVQRVTILWVQIS